MAVFNRAVSKYQSLAIPTSETLSTTPAQMIKNLESIIDAYAKKDYTALPREADDIEEEERYPDRPLYDEFLLNSKTHSQATQEFLDSIEASLDPSLSKTARASVIDTLRSEKGIKVYVPDNWNGISNADGTPFVVHFDFDPDMPKSKYQAARHINPKVFEPVHQEIVRLCQHILVPSPNAAYVHPIVVAAKKTTPFFRIAVDFKWVNMHIISKQAYVANVRDSLARMKGFKIFVDTDMTASFRQFVLGEETS
jgi:hypothetical protein